MDNDLLLISAYLDNELDTAERIQFEAHLRSNPTLQAELVELEQVIHLIRAMPRRKAPRRYTLDPAIYAAPKQKFIYPWRTVLAVAAVFTVVVLVGTIVFSGQNSKMPTDSQPVAQMKQTDLRAQQQTGAADMLPDESTQVAFAATPMPTMTAAQAESSMTVSLPPMPAFTATSAPTIMAAQGVAESAAENPLPDASGGTMGIVEANQPTALPGMAAAAFATNPASLSMEVPSAIPSIGAMSPGSSPGGEGSMGGGDGSGGAPDTIYQPGQAGGIDSALPYEKTAPGGGASGTSVEDQVLAIQSWKAELLDWWNRLIEFLIPEW